MYELDTILKVPLGGLRQKIHILGARRGNPILLFLHGGPGVPNRAGVLRSYQDLCDDFTLVAWDQRGTGGSYWGARACDLTVDRLVEDARELCDFLCDTLEQDKLSLVCGSWGTQLGTLLANRYPRRVAAYVGSAQAVDGARNEELSYAFALQKAKEAGNREDVARLEAVGPPARGQYRGGFRGLMTQRDLMKKYGGYSTAQREKSFVATFAKPMLQSGEYTPSDLLGIWLGYQKTLRVMWPRLTGYDFIHECSAFAMPYYIFQGRHDSNTPSALVEEFYQSIQAPAKDLIWFENSGHSLAGEMEKYKRLLREKLL